MHKSIANSYKKLSSFIYSSKTLLCFLEYYTPGKTEKGTASIRRCSYRETPQIGEVCDFDVRLWGECSPDKHFNYHRNAPCIFLKLNRIYGWIPEYYNDTNNLPREMPVSLTDHIRSRDHHEVSRFIQNLFVRPSIINCK